MLKPVVGNCTWLCRKVKAAGVLEGMRNLSTGRQ